MLQLVFMRSLFPNLDSYVQIFTIYVVLGAVICLVT